MDPPDAFAPPGLDSIPVEDLHPFLRAFSEEHAQVSAELDAVEAALQAVAANGFGAAADRALMKFLEVVDRVFVPHSREEELRLFPLLHQRLIASGEHSKGTTITTAVDVMRDEHLKAVQHAAVALNFIRVGACLPDETSARIIIDAGLREAANLVELLRLHMFREDHILFPSAHRLIDSDELDGLRATGASVGEV